MAITEERFAARQESRQGAKQVTHQALVRHFQQQVRHGIDEPLQRGHGLKPIRLSELLGNCNEEARALLFTACMQAKNRDRAAFVVATLCAFVDQVALDYADDTTVAGGQG